MRALITGGVGFAGRHLAQHLVACGDDVIVTQIPPAKNSLFGNLQGGASNGGSTKVSGLDVPLPKAVQTVVLDVTDAKAVRDLLSLARPDAIYHLAAITFVPDADNNPRLAYDVNFSGSLNLFDAHRDVCPRARVLYVSSSEVYGQPRPGTLPITELAELRPVSAYGTSKAAADLAAYQYAFKHRLEIVRVRPFTHTGPGQASSFALSSFARQVAEIKLGKSAPVVHVGNLEVKRDYSDVSDIVRGYREALLNGKRGGVYNLCSGKSMAIGELLQQLLKVAEVEAEIRVDESRVRAVDIPEIWGSCALAQKELGWHQRVELEGTLHSLFAYWIESLS